MKNLILLGLILALTTPLIAQDNEPVTSCYFEYYSAFRDRRAKAVPDGTQRVVVSIRKDGACTCLLGRITVQGGVPKNSLELEREDGTFEKFEFTPHPKYERSETRFVNYISNGMSPTYLSYNEEMINLFFIDYLNPVPAHYKAAPPLK